MDNDKASGYSRKEIEDVVWPAFARGCPTKTEIVRAARRKGATPALIAVLEKLPSREYGQVSAVWEAIAEAGRR